MGGTVLMLTTTFPLLSRNLFCGNVMDSEILNENQRNKQQQQQLRKWIQLI
ncbi:uncharacterized protein Smp_201480 [Schistosoma mansoni]|uniref:uncharacterized protein n=1 Tax=Schistosoma mansoni TaxID=6183 RepID=UPI00022DBEE9|nr:uncharacterized protein Smp_201480 [Schistosoma mansoni]|eukprot:XP_018650025.1 uncharacterized protein Smp_201480 [Schistosoma mansoni]